ncbi:MAG: 4-hydroxy-tetrahydrodipicolinate reductase [Ruthenibacterium sp.]
MTRIIIQGIHGKMGQTLCTMIAQRTDCIVAAGIDSKVLPCAVPVFPTLAKCDVAADVLIDFSNPSATEAALSVCAEKHLPCVICTTGLSAETQNKIKQISVETAVFQSANMSIGINLLILLAKQANTILGTDFDVEIIEKHHHNKMDAPSGTALMLADAICDTGTAPYTYQYDRHAQRKKRERNEIGIHSVRGGSIVGEHEVLFAGQDEVITLSHSATSRTVFANGAINAALFLSDRPAGLYEMKDLLKQ